MSKRIIILLTLALMMCSASAFAWEYSFRAGASGMLFWGDFDNDLDPIYIHDNQGYRFYSILSNLTSQSNEFFSGSTNDNTFLIGTSGQFGIPSKFPWESRTSFVISLADQQFPSTTALDEDMNGSADWYGNGEQDGKWVTEQNWNATNGIFDFNITNTSAVNDVEIMKNRNWQLTHSYTDGNKTLGLSIKHWGYYDEYQSPWYGFWWMSPQFDWDYNNTETVTDFTGGINSPVVTYRGSREGDFETKYENPENEFKLAFQMPFNPISNSEIRFDLAYNKHTDKWTTNDYVRNTDMFNTTAPNTDTSIASETFRGEGDNGGSFIVPGVQLTKHWAPETYSWFRVDFGFGGYDYIGTYRNDYSFYGHNTTTYGENERITAFREENYDGDGDRTGFQFYHKTIHQFSPNFLFGAGFQWMSYKEEATDVPMTYNYMYQYEYRDSADVFTGATDYRYTEMESGSAMFSETYKNCGFSFPVAMEYVQGRWTFRLGGTHHIEKWTYENAYNVDQYDVYSDTTVYGDGTGSGAVPPSGGTYEMRSQKSEYKDYWTEFYYGLQYMPNPNLRVELMDFMRTDEDFNDSEFFSGLRLGLTVLW